MSFHSLFIPVNIASQDTWHLSLNRFLWRPVLWVGSLWIYFCTIHFWNCQIPNLTTWWHLQPKAEGTLLLWLGIMFGLVWCKLQTAASVLCVDVLKTEACLFIYFCNFAYATLCFRAAGVGAFLALKKFRYPLLDPFLRFFFSLLIVILAKVIYWWLFLIYQWATLALEAIQ